MPQRPLLFVMPIALVAGCATLNPNEPVSSDRAGEAVVRGQSPEVVSPEAIAAPPSWGWEPAYLAPGEVSCQEEPPHVYEQVLPPGAVYDPFAAQPQAVAPPPAAAAPSEAISDEGWFDVLPAEGGPISPDFGLPKEPYVENRLPNPVYLPSNNPEAAWETIARTLSDYFPVNYEQRVAQQGDVLTEGRLETPWQSAATVFEPWRNDSVGAFNRWQSTLQTLRRRATVRVIPATGGYEVAVRVDKQLEDLNRPERASAGAASLRSDSSVRTDRLTPVDRVLESDRWIDIGRDDPLEQEILRELRQRFGADG